MLIRDEMVIDQFIPTVEPKRIVSERGREERGGGGVGRAVEEKRERQHTECCIGLE